MKYLRIGASLCLCISLASGPLVHASGNENDVVVQSANVPAGARSSAEVGLYTWVNNFIRNDTQPDKDFVFDVQTLQQLKSAYLGRGVAMKTVDPDQLMSGSSLHQATHANGEWRFVVMVDSRPVGLVNVRLVSGKYEVVGLGGKGLAKDIEATLAPYPGRTASLVRSYQAIADYMELPTGNIATLQYAPLQAARTSTLVTHTVQARSAVDTATGHPNLIKEAALTTELRDAIARNASEKGN